MTVAEKIREGLGLCSPAERRVGRALLSDYPAAGLDTVAYLAERAGTSGPTVLRFLSRLGFDGFGDFRDALRGEIAERTASPLSILTSDPTALADDTVLGRAKSVLPATIGRTLELLPSDEVDAAIRILADPRLRVMADGGRFTRLLADYLVRHLMQIRGGVRMLPTQPLSRTDVLIDLGRRDVLVLFDFRRYEPSTRSVAEEARAAGAKLILVTDRWLSPVAGVADIVLPVQVDAVAAVYDSLVPALALVEVLVAGVLTELGDAAERRMSGFEDASRRGGLL